MPLTRARQHTVLPVDQDDDVMSAKQRINARASSSTATQQHECHGKPPFLTIRVPSGLCRNSNINSASPCQPSLSRTVSSPAGFDAARTGGDTPLKSTRYPSRANQDSRSTRKARRQTTSSTSEDSDSSDDEARPYNLRVGGCSSDIETLNKRDDSNKENVAPLRHVSQDVLASEARDQENENIARRTRGRSSLTPRRSSSSASSVASSVRSAAPSTTIPRPMAVATRMATRNTGSAPRSSPRRAPRASTGSFLTQPSTPGSRKRRADILDQGYDASDSDVRLPNTPMRRLRLDTSVSTASDDAESYFSSQGSSVGTAFSSVFDSQSLYSGDVSACSRATTPVTTDDMDLTLRDGDGAKCSTTESSPAPFVGYSNVYAHARALFRYSAGTTVDDECASPSSSTVESVDITEVKVVGRDQERRALHAFMSKQLGVFATETHGELEDVLAGNCESGSLYICGLPGTGKTALVRSVLSDVLAASGTGVEDMTPRIAFVNCMSIDNPRQIYAKALHALGEEVRGASESHIEAEAEKRLEQLIQQSDRKVLIVLDEIDHLLRSRAHQNILYRVFSWAADGTSCALVGIANSLDLTERFVPLLASKDAAPALLHFRPFESKEIVEVLKARLVGLQSRYDGEDEDAALAESAAVNPLFMPAALELAAKKIAAATGDLRKALDAARLAIELVEGEQRKQALVNCTATGEGTSTEASKLLSHLTPSSAPKVTPQHILKVMTAVLGSPHLSKLRQLGLQPKLLLSAMIIASKRASEDMPVLGSLGAKKVSSVAGQSGIRVCDVESTYTAMLENDGSFTALESSEILGLFELLEVQGIMALDSDVETVGQQNVPGRESQPTTLSPRSGVSPGGKRAAKKQLLACNRLVHLVLPMEDVQKGITTVASALGASSESVEGGSSEAICSSIKRMMNFEEERIRRSRGWEAVAREREQVRREELGGGRMAVV